MLDEVGITLNEKRFQPGSRLILTVPVGVCVDTGADAGACVGLGVSAGNAAVTMIPSTHGLVAFGRIPYPGSIDPSGRLPLIAREYRHGEVYMPKLEMGGTIFMHAGSANLIESALNGHHCDVLFMCVPGWKKVPAYTTHLLEIVKPINSKAAINLC